MPENSSTAIDRLRVLGIEEQDASLPTQDAGGKPETQYEPGQERDAETVSATFTRIAVQQDLERVKVGASLINVFNYAVQVQAGRTNWEPDDFRAFIVAHSAIDKIGQKHIAQSKPDKVESALSQLRRTNVPQNKL